MAQREDYWSDGATECLIDAWGGHHLNRGSLRVSDWADVTDAVNRRQELIGKPIKTLTQCRNRIDTVKKKYRTEKYNKLSQWPHLAKFQSFVEAPTPNPNLNLCVGPTHPKACGKRTPRLMTFRARNESPNPNLSVEPIWSSGGTEDEEALSERRKWGGLVKCDGEIRHMADAVVGLAEVYDRVERVNMKLRREIERSRMEFVKEMEAERIKLIVDLVNKSKKSWHCLESGKKPKWNMASAHNQYSQLD